LFVFETLETYRNSQQEQQHQQWNKTNPIINTPFCYLLVKFIYFCANLANKIPDNFLWSISAENIVASVESYWDLYTNKLNPFIYYGIISHMIRRTRIHYILLFSVALTYHLVTAMNKKNNQSITIPERQASKTCNNQCQIKP
jgi:hypothetical protein